MGLCQKITAERVLADQIFVIADEILKCDLPFAAAEGATISGTLDVTVTELDFVPVHKDDEHKDDEHKDDSPKYDSSKYDLPKDHPDKDDQDKDNALQITVTLMYQKELTVTGNKSARPPFAPPGLPNTFPLEFKIEKAYKQTFCGITKRDISELGVRLSDVRAELVKIVSVTDELEFDCGRIGFGGDHGGEHDREPVIQTPGRIEDTVTTLLKIQLVTDEDLVVSLCPQNNSNTIRIPPVSCKKR